MRTTQLSIPILLYVLLMPGAFAQEGLGDAHIAIENPSELPPREINKIYDELKDRMAEAYAIAKLPAIHNYQSWKRYNATPYLSATHGQRFVNNYANSTGDVYGSLPIGQRHPTGTVLAKDAITVTADGKSFPGALFVMEKMAVGANPSTADWRYFVVNPDGSLFGDTNGEEPELVDYCHACHQAKAKQDYVFGVPEEFQQKP